MNRIVLALCIFIAFIGNAHTYYVSKTGKNTNPGTKTAPFKTIQFAVNKLNAGDVCYIRHGIYREHIRFKNSGKQNKPIILRNFPGEKVTITPTFKRHNWSKHAKNIYRTPCSEKVVQVFIAGKPSMQASFPTIREGELSTKTWENIFASPNKTVKVPGIEKYKDITGARLVGICGRGLVALNGKVIHQSGKIVELQNEAFYWNKIHEKAYLGKGKGFLVGKYAFLDAPGEWFSNGKHLYYYAKPKEFNPNEIEIRTKQIAVSLADKKYIHLQGITIYAGNLSLDNSKQCIINQATILFPTPFFTFESGFDRFGGTLNGMDYNQPKNWSGKGVVISGYGNTFINSKVQHSWGDGVTVWGNNNTLKNCIINDCDWMGIDCAPLNITGNKHLVSHSTFSKAARSVLVHRKLSHSKIRFNEISEGGMLNDDLGLTYTYDTDGNGTEIAYNFLHDNYAPHFGGGIYLDNNHKNFQVHHNVVWNCFVAMVINQKAENDLIYNNSFIHNKYSMGACRPDGGELDFTNIYSYNNITDSELKARDHAAFYGTKQINNHFIPHLSNLMVNPTEKKFQLRENALLGGNVGAVGVTSRKLSGDEATSDDFVGAKLEKQDNTSNTWNYGLFLGYFLVFAYSIYKLPKLRISGLNYWKNLGLFSIKILGAFSLFWVYTYYYPNRETADIFKHFDDALQFYKHVYTVSVSDYFQFLFGQKVDSPQMTEALVHTKYWLRQTEIGRIGDNHVLIKLHAFLLLFSRGFYPIHLLFFAFFSYLGTLTFNRFITNIFTPNNYVLLGIFLTPSVVFFCSGTLKETVILVLIIAIINSSYYLGKKFELTHLLILIISTYLLVILKVYILIALVPGLLSFLIFTFWKTKYWWLFSIFIHLSYLLLLFTLPSINFLENLQLKQYDLVLVAHEMHAGSRIEIPLLDNHFTTFLSNIPNALKNVFFLPSPSYENSFWMWLSTLENYLLLVLIVLGCTKLKYTNRSQRQFLTLVFSFSFLLALFIGWTVPIVGAIVRYKVILIGLLIPSLIALWKIKKPEDN